MRTNGLQSIVFMLLSIGKLYRLAMVKEVHVEGFEALQKAVDEHKGRQIFVLFSGSLGSDGMSWCPDCAAGKCSFKTCYFCLNS